MKLILTLILLSTYISTFGKVLPIQVSIAESNLMEIKFNDTTLNNKKYKSHLVHRNFEQVKTVCPPELKDSILTTNDVFTSIYYCTAVFSLPKGFLTTYDSLALKRLRLIAEILVKENTPIILTYGYNGNSSRGDKNLDSLTRKYGFVYIPIGSGSCTPSRMNVALSAFNSIVESHLDGINEPGWKQRLESELFPPEMDKKVIRKKKQKLLTQPKAH